MSGAHEETRPEAATLDGEFSGPGAGPLTGDLGDRFRILDLLGRGGMGEVYAAEDLTLGRRVALKAIRPERRLTAVARDRFLREARLLSRLDHPGICRIHDLVEIDGRDFLVLELIEGRTLRAARESLDDRARLDIALQIAAVLEAAHVADVVHRDLKPENIMLTDDGVVKVLDFGLARDTGHGEVPSVDADGDVDPDRTVALTADVSRGGAVMGTPAYLSPEQARGEAALPASDMYAFGLVLQRMFTGQMPYEESSEIKDVLAQAREARTRPVTGIDRDLGKLIERLKSRSAAARPTAVDTRRRLAWIQRKPARRLRRLTAAAVVLLVLAGVGKYMLDLRHERAIAQRNRAEAEDLVEFMLGDLRERLEPVGRLDALDEVGDRALAYFAARSADERTDADYHRFARAMTQIGEVRVEQGDLEAAGEAFGQARSAAASLVEKDPRNGDWLLTLGATEFWVGTVGYYSGDMDAAESAYLAYRDIAARGLDMDPSDETWQREMGYAHTNLAAVYEYRGDMDAARGIMDESIRLKRDLLAADPGNPQHRFDLVNAMAWQGRVLLAAGRLRAAAEYYGMATVEADVLLQAQPDHTRYLELQSSLQFLYGRSLERFGQDAESRALLLSSLRTTRDLARHDPENASWRLNLVVGLVGLAQQDLRTGRLAEADARVGEALPMIADLVTLDPANADYLLELADTRWTLAAVAHRRGDRNRAQAEARLALARARESRVTSGDENSAVILARCLLLAGDLAAEDGREPEARSFVREACDLLAPFAAETRVDSTLETWAHALAAAGRREEARQVSADLLAMGFSRRGFAEFRAEQGL